MSKDVLISLHPKGCEKIASGEMTLTVRKTRPKLQTPFKCYIYCTNPRHYVDSRHWFSYPAEPLWITANKDVKSNQERGDGDCILLNGKIIGEFVCDSIQIIDSYCYSEETADTSILADMATDIQRTCMTLADMREYAGSRLYLHGWHISELKIYDTPKELSEFIKYTEDSIDDLLENESLCSFCASYDYGRRSHWSSPITGGGFCEGNACGDAYRAYLKENFTISRPPQSWCYVEDVHNKE